ncbi:hypothetical protein ACSNN7_14135 [Micromonospora sp. URMC 105]|uniref:hypothetical protein n=1 Tax=Micromonospora sp. URMC 105 TaxID=3423413 RepID=UPI003F1A405B
MRPTQAGTDRTAAVRKARFGKLPERIRPEDMVEEQATSVPDPAKDTYNSDEWLIRNAV